jgi:purine-binding chemotaxis protein CheW
MKREDFSVIDETTAAQKQQILEERAAALAHSAEPGQVPSTALRMVEFLLAQQHYAVETRHVREVQQVTNITPIPCTPLFVLGVINVRGRILSVIDLATFFDLPHTPSAESGVVMVLGAEDMEVGVRVDELLGTRLVAEDDLSAATTGHSSIRCEYLQGVAKEQLLLLDVERLLSDNRLLVGADETEI